MNKEITFQMLKEKEKHCCCSLLPCAVVVCGTKDWELKEEKNPERKEVSKLSKSHRVVSSQSRSKREISRFIYNLGFIPLNLWVKIS